MRQFICLIIFYSIIIISFGQANNPYKENASAFIKEVFATNQKNIALEENIDSSTFHFLKQILLKDTFYKRTIYNDTTINIDTFVFTKDDRLIIDSFFSKYENFNWQNSYWPNTKIIPGRIIDSVKNNDIRADDYLSKYYHTLFVTFYSKPIFLRNNTICIFYFANDNDFFGSSSSLAIYKKINGKWKRYNTIYEDES